MVALHLTTYLGVLVDLTPYAHHQTNIHLVETVGECLGIRVELLVELHGVPTILPPILPVLHDDAQGHLLIAETTGGLQDLIGGVETLAAMDIAQCPLGHQGTRTREFAIRSDNLIRGAYEDRIIYGIGNGRTEGGLIAYLIIIKGGLIVLGEFCREEVTACFDMYDGRSRRGQPEVLHLNHCLPVDAEVMATGHLLPHVEQQGIVACLCHVDDCFEDMALAHFLLIAFRTRHVDFFRLSLSFRLLQTDTLATGIKLRQSVVVPQDAIALA